jgi:hypothetical protein
MHVHAQRVKNGSFMPSLSARYVIAGASPQLDGSTMAVSVACGNESPQFARMRDIMQETF